MNDKGYPIKDQLPKEFEASVKEWKERTFKDWGRST